MTDKINKSDEQWQQELSTEEFAVCRQKGTEKPFTGEYFDSKEEGMYHCRCCGEPLFSSTAKYDSGTGWPSFYRPATGSGVEEAQDQSLAMSRTEILCSRCGSHLGHVFPDGPQPTGLRYCVNSLSLKLEKNDKSTPVEKTSIADIEAFTTKDGSIIRELMHPDTHGNMNQSLAEARISVGQVTRLHKHITSEELYFVAQGEGVMTLADRKFLIKTGDTVLIPPGTPHKVENKGDSELILLCCCSPAYSHADTELLQQSGTVPLK